MFITTAFLAPAYPRLFIHRDVLAHAWLEIAGEPVWPFTIGRA